MNTTSRVRKVYTLRKTVPSSRNKQKAEQERVQKQQLRQFRGQSQQNIAGQILQNKSIFKKNKKQVGIEENYNLQEQTTLRSVEGPQLSVNTLFLNFEEKLDCIQTKQIRLKNIGSSAIYYLWKFKNQAKINSNAIKDVKPKFSCHYAKQSIKPGQELTFIFSFVSQIQGYFTQQCELLCQPALITPIPIIRLQGKVYIDDEWKLERVSFLKQLQESVRQCSVYQTVDDMIGEVKVTETQLPRMKDLKVAEVIFEKVNQNLKLYFNAYIHGWYNQLFEQVWRRQQEAEQERRDMYWDQSVQTFRKLISDCSKIDEVQRMCFLQRLEHYTYLSTFPLPDKSQLYQAVHNILFQAALHIGAEHADAARKQLDMWQVPFRQPLQTDTEEDLKGRKQQVQKIKAQWLKRTKKKKWAQQDEKQMVQEFKSKVMKKASHQILAKFEGFEEQAEYTRCQKIMEQDSFDPTKYFLFLQRMKTVNEYQLEGKKVLLKFNLKLKDNCQKELDLLNQYLIGKEQDKKRIQEQKKNLDSKKRKPVPKKKGHKQQQQHKHAAFDFSSILDQQNWNGFIDTLRLIQQRSPFLILIGCTYRERLGKCDPNLTVAFLLEHLKNIEPSIQFMTHDQLFNIKQDLQNQVISQGSIYFVENLNFLPSQTLVCQQTETYQQDGVQKPRHTNRNVLYPQVRNNLDLWATHFDVIVDEDKFLQKPSGISSYSHLQVVLGKTWWNYVAYTHRASNQTVILSGDFSPQNYFLITRLLKYMKKIYLTGALGAKFRMASQSLKQLGNLKLNDKQIQLIRQVTAKTTEQKLFVPKGLKFLTNAQEGQQRKCIIKTFEDPNQSHQKVDLSHCDLVDITDSLGDQISKNSSEGHLFMIGKSHTIEYDQKAYGMNSTVNILRNVYKIQQQKRERHSIEVNDPAGIDFNKDLVFYLVGIDQKYVQKIQLKQKKVKIASQQQGQDQQQLQQNQQPQDQSESQKKKIDLVADVKLNSEKIVKNLLSGKFDYGLKNIRKYPKPRII